jgi:hypothetical protein
VDVKLADSMAEGWRVWLDWHRVIAPENHSEIEAIEADAGRYIGYVRTVAERRPDLDLSEPIESISGSYQKQPLLHP